MNKLTAVHKFSLLNRGKLMLPIQIQVPKKQKIFQNFLFNFEMSIKFCTLSKKDDPHSSCFSEITESEKRG